MDWTGPWTGLWTMECDMDCITRAAGCSNESQKAFRCNILSRLGLGATFQFMSA